MVDRLRAPAAHRAVAALASPVIGYFVARLLLLNTALPETPTYAVCVALGAWLGWRAWSARVVLEPHRARVYNALATKTVHRHDIRRVDDRGRIEWHSGAPRPVRLPAEALRRPWWTLGLGESRYARNREEARDWLRTR
jgi:hypothetical protein